jgi:hypothetical protein
MNLELINITKDKIEYRLGLFVLMTNFTSVVCLVLFINKVIEKTGGINQYVFSPALNIFIGFFAILLIIYFKKLILVLSWASCVWLGFIFFKYIIYSNNILVSMSK